MSTWREGDPVYAAADGLVVTVDNNNYFGNYIVIKHKGELSTLYARLSEVKVKQGEKVSQGEIIGATGNTGEGNGFFLHYEIHRGMDVVDPMAYLILNE